MTALTTAVAAEVFIIHYYKMKGDFELMFSKTGAHENNYKVCVLTLVLVEKYK